MSHVAVLSNAGSGRNRRRRELLDTLSRLSEVDHRITASAAEVPAVLDELLARRPGVLAINGGDGTVQTVLTALEASARPVPPIAVLPAGSTNMTAADLGSGSSLRLALRTLLRYRRRPPSVPELRERVPLAVTDAGGRKRIGFFFGAGTIVRGVRYWHEALARGRGTGQWGAGAALARAAWGIARGQPPFAAPLTARLGVKVDGRCCGERDLEMAFVLVTTMERLFLGIRPFWGAGEGALACTWVDHRPRRLVPRLPALLRGRGDLLPAADGYHACRPERVRLGIDEPWLIDGEIFEAPGPLELTAARPRRFLRLERQPGRGRG